MDSTNRKPAAAMGKDDAEALALQALLWLLSDETRADRLLELTGLTPDALRAGLSDSAILSALLGYLTNYEPDLVDFARAHNTPPENIAKAYYALSGDHWEN